MMKIIIFVFVGFFLAELVYAAYSGDPYGSGCYGIGNCTSNVETSSGGGGGGGAGGVVIFSGECTSNNQCSEGRVCRNNKCLRLFDIKIAYADSPFNAGGFLDFSYLIKDISQISDDVIIEFSLEDLAAAKIVSEGKETIFIEKDSETVQSSKIWVPIGLEGLYILRIKVIYEDYSAEASQTLEILQEKEIENIFSIFVSNIDEVRDNMINSTIFIFANTDYAKAVNLTISLKENGAEYLNLRAEHSIIDKLEIPFEVKELKTVEYLLLVTLNFDNKTTVFERKIYVSEKEDDLNIESPRKISGQIWIILLVLIILILVIYFIVYKDKKLKQRRKKRKSNKVETK